MLKYDIKGDNSKYSLNLPLQRPNNLLLATTANDLVPQFGQRVHHLKHVGLEYRSMTNLNGTEGESILQCQCLLQTQSKHCAVIATQQSTDGNVRVGALLLLDHGYCHNGGSWWRATDVSWRFHYDSVDAGKNDKVSVEGGGV